MNLTSIPHIQAEIDLIILKRKLCDPRIRLVINIFRVLITRLVLVAESSILIAFMVCITKEYPFLILITLLLIMVLDAFWICIRRRGKEYEIFSLGTFLFTIVFIIQLWYSSYYKNNILNNVECKGINAELQKKAIGNCLKININPCEGNYLFVSLFLLSVILTRYITPFSSISNHKMHSILLIAYLSSSADIIDLVEYANSEKIMNAVGIHTIYFVTTLSVFQFSFSLNHTKRIEQVSKGVDMVQDFLFGTEAWSTLLILITQDIPFLVIRVIIVSNLGLFVNGTLCFFLLKNIIMICVDIYRLYIFYAEFKEIRQNLLKQNTTISLN